MLEFPPEFMHNPCFNPCNDALAPSVRRFKLCNAFRHATPSLATFATAPWPAPTPTTILADDATRNSHALGNACSALTALQAPLRNNCNRNFERPHKNLVSLPKGLLGHAGKPELLPLIFDDLAEVHRASGVSDEPPPAEGEAASASGESATP